MHIIRFTELAKFHTTSRALAVNMQILKAAKKLRNMESMLNMQRDLKGTISYQRLPHDLKNFLLKEKVKKVKINLLLLVKCWKCASNDSNIRNLPKCAPMCYKMLQNISKWWMNWNASENCREFYRKNFFKVKFSISAGNIFSRCVGVSLEGVLEFGTFIFLGNSNLNLNIIL